MNLLINVIAFVAAFFALISVHEFGHYLAGCAAGIPARDMRVRVFVFPQRVDLRANDRWIWANEWELFLATMWGHLKTTPRVYLYVCGGLVMETIFSVAVTIGFVALGRRDFAFLVAFSTILHYVTYLMWDIPSAWRRGHAMGDFSGLWALARFPTALLVSALLTIQFLLLWYVRHR